MLAVKAVSNYTALAGDQIDVKEGQLFYVLSMTSDGRKYYLSTSSRVPFSRVARSGYAPVPLFIVVGDTLPPSARAKVKIMISDSNAPQPTARVQRGDAKPMPLPRKNVVGVRPTDDRLEELPAALPEQEPRKTLSHNISAAARYWFGGIMRRPSRDGPRSNAFDSPDASSECRSGSDDHVAESLPSSLAPTTHVSSLGANVGSHVTGAQIVTYAKRKNKVVYRIKFTLADGTELFARRTYEDIQNFDSTIRRRYAELPALPAPVALKEEEVTAAARGKELNVYLQGVVRIHRHLVAKGGNGLGLHEVVFGESSVQDVSAVQDQVPASAVNKYLPFGLGGKRRGSSADSGFASRPPSRKNSIQSDVPLPAMADDSQNYGVVNANKQGNPQVLPLPAALQAFPENPTSGGFAAKVTKRLERIASLDRSSARV